MVRASNSFAQYSVTVESACTHPYVQEGPPEPSLSHALYRTRRWTGMGDFYLTGALTQGCAIESMQTKERRARFIL